MKRLAFLLALVPFPAAADYSGNQIHTLCQTNPHFLDGYMAGLMDKARQDWLIVGAMMPMTADTKSPEEFDRTRKRMLQTGDVIIDYCVPDGAKLGQAVDIVCKSLRENPADRQKSAAYLAVEAMKAAWPCRK